MLMNRKEMETWLIDNKRLDRNYENDWHLIRDRKIPKDLYIPVKYNGIYEPIGYYNFWDEWGTIASCGLMYKSVKSGHVYYEVS